ncbi:hypothetical protein [Staphylococcus succinus]|uniref:hypothetical protein n=1 Tax=Staphylococcus succinus TaxID=61015 RepID=UPI001C03B144|nr:hypothetical protein [Staphylococcus succinus]MBU0439330.1 hypothetical protein [Staphylococcus succinus]
MKSKNVPILLYDESGSREDIDIYLQRIEELENQNKKVSGVLVKICLALIILSAVSLFFIKFSNYE